MAIDKAVDSAVLDAGLLQIANAIREKAGTEGALAFPDGFVEALAAGGGLKMTYGVITPNESISGWTCEHNLGVIPKLVIRSILDEESNSSYCLICEVGVTNEFIGKTDDPYRIIVNRLQYFNGSYNSVSSYVCYDGYRITHDLGLMRNGTETTVELSGTMVAGKRYFYLIAG